MRKRVTTDCGGTEDAPHGRTRQSHKDECDVNKIVQRYASTGLVSHVSSAQPTYGDFTAADDLFTAINRVRAAEANFARLPAMVRKLCDHSSVELLKRLADPEATAELVEAGLKLELDPEAAAELAAIAAGSSSSSPAKPASAEAEAPPSEAESTS